MIKITNNIYWVGVFNPNMRIFDIIMCTNFGTTYNAYLINDQKNVLVDTVHTSYCEQYFKNINEIVSIEQIDYLVVNHCEPDHSGCIEKLITLNPKIVILCSVASSIYLKKICNKENLNIKIVKDNEEIDIGSRRIKFITAPFLHWPDTMFTYINDDKLIFTCDFLGTHYCEPYVFDYMMNKKHTNDFYKEVKNYYDAIFGPFPKHVQYGLNKIKSLDVNIACVSHGPILTKKSQLNSIIKLYDDLSIQQKNNSYLPIFYASAYGYTKQLAQSIADGISSAIPSIEVKLYDINEHSINELSNIINSVNYFGIGSPTINRSVVAPIMNLLSTIDGINSGDKQAFVFGSFGWSGEAVEQISQYLKTLRIKMFGECLKVKFVPSNEEINKAKQFGTSFAAIIKK